ncbi:STAS domain-containing protein [Streptomyces sp. NPDC096136]|uniref:STAS domain-containing protein n=1 Tax=Streptomyces sp. NPDC096136 TaxID=3366076 RepID=UPI0037F749A5
MTSHPDCPPPAAADLSSTLRSSVVSVTFEPGPQRVLAHVRGEIDMDDVDGLHTDLAAGLAASRDGLDVDLSAVTFCDSSGLHILLDLHRLAQAGGKSVVLTALSNPVARLIRMTGADDVLTVHGRPAPRAARADGGPARRDRA